LCHTLYFQIYFLLAVSCLNVAKNEIIAIAAIQNCEYQQKKICYYRWWENVEMGGGGKVRRHWGQKSISGVPVGV